MKLVEALKEKKRIKRQLDDYVLLVKDHCAIPSTERPRYGSDEAQREQVNRWIQGHFDLLKRYSNLSLAITKTNIETVLSIDLDGKVVTKTLAEWILRARELATLEYKMWSSITDRGIREEVIPSQIKDGQPFEKRIVRFYDPKKREEMRMSLLNEPSIITAKLEIANAETDLIGFVEDQN